MQLHYHLHQIYINSQYFISNLDIFTLHIIIITIIIITKSVAVSDRALASLRGRSDILTVKRIPKPLSHELLMAGWRDDAR